MNINYCVTPTDFVQGQLQVPGDKSISHRAIMFGAIAEGKTEVEGFLEGADALSTIAAFRAMGVNIEGPNQGRLCVHGVGMHGLREAAQFLDCGNSGTMMRLIAGLLVGQRFPSVLLGDESLMRRPMRRIVEPLASMGADISVEPNGCAPIRITPAKHLRGIAHTMKAASAQVKSALLLAGLYAEGETTVVESAITRDHTERMLASMGADLKCASPSLAREISIKSSAEKALRPLNLHIPGDFSSATFWLVAGSIAPNLQSEILLTHVGMNPSRNGAIAILQMMGADIQLLNPREVGGEPVADLHVRPALLQGIRIPEKLVSLAIDEFPALFIAASAANGITKLTGAAELRVKESDRLKSMADGLAQIGINHELLDDGIIIEGQDQWQGSTSIAEGGGIVTNADHRIAMSFAVAALRARAPIYIRDCANVATSYPNFVAQANQLGLALSAV